MSPAPRRIVKSESAAASAARASVSADRTDAH